MNSLFIYLFRCCTEWVSSEEPDRISWSLHPLIGLELDHWSPNGHDGKFKDTEYFKSVDGRGFFVRHDLITSRADTVNPLSPPALHTNTDTPCPNARIGDRVQLKNGLLGSVRFKGNVDFSTDEYLGLALEKRHYNGGNGEIQGRVYFTVKKRRGYFAKPTEVARILTAGGAKRLKHLKKMKSLSAYPRRGDIVKTIKGQTGTVRYIGSTMFAPGSGILIGMYRFNISVQCVANDCVPLPAQDWNSLIGGPMDMMA